MHARLRLLFILLLAMMAPGIVQAQAAWQTGVAIGSSGVPVGASSTIVANVTSIAAVGAQVQITLTDPSGKSVATPKQPETFAAGQTIQVSYVYSPTAASLNGTYSVGLF